MGMPPGMFPGRKPNIIFAVLMIAAGVLLFLTNLGIFPIHRVQEFWPVIFIFFGVGRIIRRPTPGSFLVGLTCVAIGTIATLISTGVLRVEMHDGSWPLALVFITLGVVGLARVMDGEPWAFGNVRYRRNRWGRQHWRFQSGAFNPADLTDTDPILNDHTMMGNIKRRIESQNFQGGRISSTMGNIKLDMRRAKMPDGQKLARIDVHSIMGNVTLRIPESWNLRWDGENIMGNFVDKTIPPITGPDAPQLIVTGSCTMGNIEIEN